MPAEAGAFGPEEFAAAVPVSRETLAHLKLYASLLADWNERHNLVSSASLADVWQRHFLDSAQLAALKIENNEKDVLSGQNNKSTETHCLVAQDVWK